MRRSGRRRRVALFTTAALGLALQMFQREDLTPEHRYFTVWSAVAICLYGSEVLRRAPAANRFIRMSGSTGALLSAVVYLLAIAPANGFGTHSETIAANIVLHVALPIVVIASHRGCPAWSISPKEATYALAFPGAYLLFVIVEALALGTPPVYAFLNPAQVGVAGFGVTLVGTAAAYWFLAFVLGQLANLGATRAKYGTDIYGGR